MAILKVPSSHTAFVGKIELYLRRTVLSRESAGHGYCKALGEKGVLLNSIAVVHK